ncbi:serine hydrolase domain-containing protein [Amycolatopsis minnesotensis]|uniref:Serine hydrolase domain-containing protein n=1 Tax=Amycolatopsis minnesotensis TaxID=337894 RepID=A0ABN2RJT4_9PSEU
MPYEDLEALLAGLAAKHQVPGAQLVVRTAEGVVAVETGERASGSGDVVTASTAFPIGSITKAFTAALVMVLVGDGDIELDAPLAETLPWLDSTITARQVLSHTSGLAANSDLAGPHDGPRARWVGRHCRAADLAHRPGTVFSYSGDGYVLLGHLVEEVTGMSWWEALDAILLRPLGITAGSIVEDGPRARDVASGHTVQSRLGRVLPVVGGTLPSMSAPEGALALSASDLVTFARMHLGDPELPRPLASDALATMRQDQTGHTSVGPYGMADGWGLGWGLYRRDGVEWFGHDGTIDGTSSHLRCAPGDGTVVALTTNASSGAALWDDLAEHLSVGSRSLSKLDDEGPPVPAPPDCAGRYVNGALEFTIDHRDDGLYLLIGGEPQSKVTTFGGLTFTLHDLNGGAPQVGRFLRSTVDGRVDLIQCLGRLATRVP